MCSSRDHIEKARQWIKAAQERIKKPSYTGDPIKLLNEALVELDLAMGVKNEE